VEGEQGMNNLDVTMSDAPGDGGDDDSHSNTHDKRRGTDLECNVKRTKNDEDLNEDKGAPKLPQKSNTKSVAMHMMKHASGGGLEKNPTVLPSSENAPRYDDVFFGLGKLCISPKQLFPSLSVVMEELSEGVSNAPRFDPNATPVNIHNMVYVPKSVIICVEGRSTSITHTVHGARGSRHAEPGRVATEASVMASRPAPAKPSCPSAPTGGPAVPGLLCMARLAPCSRLRRS
jgi:hypothetical protein